MSSYDVWDFNRLRVDERQLAFAKTHAGLTFDPLALRGYNGSIQMPSAGLASQYRLDSWKEIAVYLRREVRTVQRWEAKEGLPVHRHLHDTQVTVYAYSTELDEWLAKRRPAQDIGDSVVFTRAVPLPWGLRTKVFLFGGSVLILLVIGLAWTRTRAVGARLGFQARDWVLLAGFENRTGEPLFDGTLQYALQRELSNSRSVNVVPPERAEDALRLMRKPPETPIDVATGREICLRDGGIRLLLTGKGEKLGSTYLFSVQLVEPSQGRILAVASEQAASMDQVWPAVRKLSNWVRQSLGEELSVTPRDRERLQQVTTPSLRALQLYTQAEAVGRENQWGASEQLVRQALEYDSEFASGWIWLAWSVRNQGKPAEEYGPFTDKAMRLATKASEHERLFILGSYQEFAGRAEKAVEAYSALLRLHPEDFWSRHNLIYLSSREELPSLLASYADLRPNDLRLNGEAAVALAASGDLASGRRYLGRARGLITRETSELLPAEQTEVELFPVHDSWLNDDPKSGLEELSRLGQRFNSLSPVRRQIFARHAGLSYLGFGQVKTAEEWFQKIDDEAEAQDLFALAAYVAGDEVRCREYAAKFRQRPGGEVGYHSGIALARVGPVPEPQKFINHYEKRVENIVLIHLKGEVALSQGNIEEAIHLLTQATDDFRSGGNQELLISSDGLALALERHGQPQEALRVLEDASQERFLEFAWNSPFGVFWLRIQAHLAKLYRELGRTQEASNIEHQLRRVLAYADPDHPILLQLKQAS